MINTKIARTTEVTCFNLIVVLWFNKVVGTKRGTLSKCTCYYNYILLTIAIDILTWFQAKHQFCFFATQSSLIYFVNLGKESWCFILKSFSDKSNSSEVLAYFIPFKAVTDRITNVFSFFSYFIDFNLIRNELKHKDDI